MHLNSADTHCVTVPVLGKCPARNKMVVSYTGLKAIDFPSNTGYETIYRDRKQYSGWCRNRETNEWDTWLPFSICKKQKKNCKFYYSSSKLYSRKCFTYTSRSFALYPKENNFQAVTERGGQVVTATASSWGGPTFTSRPTDRLS